MEGVYDIPEKNVIIEKDEPAATVVTGGNTIDNAVNNAQKIVNKVYMGFGTLSSKNTC